MSIFKNTLQNTSIPSSNIDNGIALASEYTDDANYTRSSKYTWIDEYYDDDFSVIDSQKNVSLSQSQINLTQEDNSQAIPFKMPRYYDGIDLAGTSMLFQIHFVNSKKREGLSTPINFHYNSDTIKFYWLVSSLETQQVGQLKFEIIVSGSVNYVDEYGISKVKNYVWKTKPNSGLNILESLEGNGSIQPTDGWDNYLQTVVQFVSEANANAAEAKRAAQQAKDVANTVDGKIENVATSIAQAVESNIESTHYNKNQIDQLFADFDISDQLESIEQEIQGLDGLKNLGISYDTTTGAMVFKNGTEVIYSCTISPTSDWTEAFREELHSDIVDATAAVSTSLSDYITTNESALEVIRESIENIDVSETVYTKEEVDQKLTDKAESSTVSFLSATVSDVRASVETTKNNITTLGNKVSEFENVISNLDTTPPYRYKATYNDDGEYTFKLLRYTGEDDENAEVQDQFVIQGGAGGSSGGSTLKISYITTSPYTVITGDKVIVKYNYESVDSTGDPTDSTYTWKIGNTIVATGPVMQGENYIDLTDFVNVGSQKAVLTITDTNNSIASKSWTIQVVNVNLTTTFNDTFVYPIGPVSFDYTPIGAIPKVVHFSLDGIDLPSVNTTSSGIPMSYSIPEQVHGSHLLETYITAEVNGTEIETSHIYRDIMWYDENNDSPVISCNTQDIIAQQYNTTNIKYTVYDPKTETPHVTLAIDGNVLSTLTLTENTNIWAYKSADVGMHTLTITCKDVVKTIYVNVTKLDIQLSPVTAGLVFDFNPVGFNNNDVNRLWSDNEITMSVSDNFDWINGGYQIDDNGDQYFKVSAGTTATINYNLFADDAKRNGKEFKIVYKVTNVHDGDTTFLSCYSDGVGIKMQPHHTFITSTAGELEAPYCEDSIIEAEFNINKDSDIPMVMSYEDGVGLRPMIYDGEHSFSQVNPVPITIGSQECDVWIYRMKAYNASLTDKGILNNFIADARNANEIIDRYNRNQIYDENGNITPEGLAKACPQLRIIKIEAPYFTNDKKDFVKNTSMECIYKNGDPVLDNWKFENAYHAGQGTTSNEYGYAGRNIDVIACLDGVNPPNDKIAADPTYVTKLTMGDGSSVSNGTGKITFTRDSVPTNWINFKVNIASSENANNALLQKRYNDFIPYISLAQKRDYKIKNDMEFVNCVIFIKENNADLTTHREFNDTDWHFYALGNMGDSKKTDASRAYDPNDMNEFTVEFSDNTLANSTFQTGFYEDNGDYIYPVTKRNWSKINNYIPVTESNLLIKENLPIFYENVDNSYVLTSDTTVQINKTYYQAVYNSNAYKSLYVDEYSLNTSNGKISQTSGWDTSFEFRYDCCGDAKDGAPITSSAELDKQREVNKQVFRNFYEWVITSTNAEFLDEYADWVIPESMLYWYLFTEHHTMIDNRAKNTFWHFAKTGEHRVVKHPIDSMIHVYDELIDGEYIRTEDKIVHSGKTYYCEYAFDMWNYDNDSSIGINNSGELTMPYGKEDYDYKVDGDQSSGYIYNGAQSVFWCRTRDLMYSRLASLYNSIDVNCWSASHLINEFDKWQSMFPEEVWRLDIERKYYRTFLGGGLNGSATPRFLKEMMNGRKKFQRRQWIKDQEKYMGTKYLTSTVRADQIMFRCNTPVGSNVVVKPDYTLHITPYSDMYLSVLFGNSSTVNQIRAKAGVQYDIDCPYTTMDDTAVLVYCASRIQSMGDISACYIHDNDFSKAEKLQELIIGNNTIGYQNTFLTSLGLGGINSNNKLLKKLDIRNTPNLTTTIDLSACVSVEELYAEGSGITGVTFATGGLLKNAYLPSSISSLTLKNLHYLNELNIAGYENIIKLVIENCPTIDSVDFITKSKNLRRIRAIGVNWYTEDTWLKNLIDLTGVDASGYEINQSVITGTAHIPATDTFTLEQFNAIWPDLVIDVPGDAVLRAYTVTFRNPSIDPNPAGQALDVQHIIEGRDAVDPITRKENPIPIPTMTVYLEDGITIEKDYTFRDWDLPLTNIRSDRTITALYDESEHMYNIQFLNIDNSVIYSTTAPYGSTVSIPAGIPTYTRQESSYVYNLFTGWDKYPIVTGNTIIKAQYDTYKYNENDLQNKSLSDMRPVEIYALIKNKNKDTGELPVEINYKDSIELTIGQNYNYSNVSCTDLISTPRTFSGNRGDYFDTGISLLANDEDWILVVDYMWDHTTANNSVLMQCYQANGSNGFRMRSQNGYSVLWGTDSKTFSSAGLRDMVVLRHVKGEKSLHVYDGNQPNIDISYAELNSIRSTTTNDAKLIFGASRADDGIVESYAKGTIYSAKLYNVDIGDAACRELVLWPREHIEMEVAGFRKYYLSDDSGRATITFLASHLLTNQMIGYYGSNNGGWNATEQKSILNERLFNAFPIDWKQIIKACKISANVGYTSSGSNENNATVSTSDCYITIPSILELSSNYMKNPYTLEAGEPDENGSYTINYILTADDRVRKYPNGVKGRYLTRSAMPQYSYAWFSITGEAEDYLASGVEDYWSSSGSQGVLIEFSI